MRCALSLVLSVFGWGLASPYRTLSVEEALSAPPGTLVRVWGRYQTETQGRVRIDGQLVSGDRVLPVAGHVFDWRPEPGALVELWGKLEPGSTLRFHNGRAAAQPRRPHPTPPLHAGETMSVWLEVRNVDPARFPFTQGVTEDRRAFFLPKYQGPHGVVCLRGEVGFLGRSNGRRSLLRGATRCTVK